MTTPGAGQVLTFAPTGDAYVRADYPTNNYGTATSLEVDGSPVKDFLLNFSVSGVGTRRIVSVKLRLYCVDSSSGGGGVFHGIYDTNWSESQVTWNNAPAADAAVLASLGPVTSGLWYEADLTSLVTGGGVWSVRAASVYSDGADYTSKEGTPGFGPQLVVTLAS